MVCFVVYRRQAPLEIAFYSSSTLYHLPGTSVAANMMGGDQRAIDEMWRRSDLDKLNGKYPAYKLSLGNRLCSFASNHLSRILFVLMVMGFGLGVASAILLVEWNIDLPGLAVVGLTMAMSCLSILIFFRDFMAGPQNQAEQFPMKSMGMRVVGIALLLIGAALMLMSVANISLTILSATPEYVPKPSLLLWLLSFDFAFIGAGFIAEKRTQLAMILIMTFIVWALAIFVAFFIDRGFI